MVIPERRSKEEEGRSIEEKAGTREPLEQGTKGEEGTKVVKKAGTKDEEEEGTKRAETEEEDGREQQPGRIKGRRKRKRDGARRAQGTEKVDRCLEGGGWVVAGHGLRER